MVLGACGGGGRDRWGQGQLDVALVYTAFPECASPDWGEGGGNPSTSPLGSRSRAAGFLSWCSGEIIKSSYY